MVTLFSLTHMGKGREGDLLSLLDVFYRESVDRKAAKRRRLRKVVGIGLKKVQRVVHPQEEGEADVKEADRCRRWGLRLGIS